ncbi:hypothetical protein FHW79_003254 [Azospirillum sp. OGB3]|uniref:hypothetical protein n=1 Tax=Azospirillum sp. OGB3 TaxID=2587012 RepID=UPI001606E427|nr:hypothetical protein [Azospirillum sp. OGB3]MBB3265625.1 hypothetical protein [Azospirillum sp. OGB3]
MGQRLAIFVAFVLTLSGCVAMTPATPEVSVKDFPEIGKTVTREVGETIIDQENIKVFPAAYFSHDLKYAMTALYVGFRKDTPYVADQIINGQKAYCGQGFICGGFNNDCQEGQPVCFVKGKSSSQIDVLGKFGLEAININPNLIRYSRAAAFDSVGFRRYLVYTGKSGPVIHLGYKEHTSELDRPAFSQDLKFDLSESRVIGFKGARFEILSATSTEITYKMLTGFADRTD